MFTPDKNLFSDKNQEETAEQLEHFRKYVEPEEAVERSIAALRAIWQYSQIDGSHHKTWTLNQITKLLTGEKYDSFVEDYSEIDPETGEPSYSWDEGIAP